TAAGAVAIARPPCGRRAWYRCRGRKSAWSKSANAATSATHGRRAVVGRRLAAAERPPHCRTQARRVQAETLEQPTPLAGPKEPIGDAGADDAARVQSRPVCRLEDRATEAAFERP